MSTSSKTILAGLVATVATPTANAMVNQMAAPKRLNKLPPLIEQRPPSSGKTRWKMDTVIGLNHTGILVTLTERSSNYLLMGQSEDKSADSVEKGVFTTTSDNGGEFADYGRIAKAVKADFFFVPFQLT